MHAEINSEKHNLTIYEITQNINRFEISLYSRLYIRRNISDEPTSQYIFK